MPCAEGELCYVPATSPKPTEAHGCQGGCGGRLHGTCGSIADDNKMHRICSACLAKGEKRKAVAPPKRKATAPPMGAGAGKSKARKTKKFLTFEQMVMVEVLDMLQRKVLSHELIADSFGCSERTVRQIKADRVKIKEQATKAGAGGKKISRQGDFPEVDESALDLFAKAREANISVTRDVIRSFGRSAKATLLATATTSAAVREKLEGFTAGDKWAKNFVKRNGLSSQRLRGEAGSVNPVLIKKDIDEVNALNILSMSVRDAQQQGSRVEDEDIREMSANLDITPGEATSEGAMDAIRVWATVEDEVDVAEAMRGDAAEEITARLAGTQVDASSKEEKKEEEDDDDESTEPGRGAPSAYAELSPHFGVLERAAEECGNKDAAIYLSKARMSMIAAHSAKRTLQTLLKRSEEWETGRGVSRSQRRRGAAYFQFSR